MTTTTTDTTPTNTALSRTSEEWGNAWANEFPTWGITASSAGIILHNAAQMALTLGVDITDALVREHVIVPLTRIGFYSRGSFEEGSDDERVLNWLLLEVESGAPEEESGEEATEPITQDDKNKFEANMRALMPTLHSGSDQHWSKYVEVLEYQFSNWKRSKYVCHNTSRALAQFSRRMNRQYGWSPSDSASDANLRHALDWLRRTAAGETVPMLPVLPARYDFSRMLERESITPHVSWHYLGVVMSRIAQRLRRDGDMPDLPAWWTAMQPDLIDYMSTSTIASITEDDKQSLYDLFMLMTFGTEFSVDPVEGVTDKDALTEWLLGLHEEAGSLQRDAIRYGVEDWFDMARTEPGVLEAEGLVESLRRMVVAYGFSRFTGKVSRMTLRATLDMVLDANRGAGLSDEEWRARWARRDKAVSYVSGRYGEQNDMCSTLERACRELGVDPTRKPKHTVRFKGSGVTVEVEVESWSDDESRLLTSARSTWDSMSEAQREAAVVARHEVHVNWRDMSMAR